MVLHPHVQERAQEEIDRVCGTNRSPTHEDDLPYVKYVFLPPHSLLFVGPCELIW